MPSTGGKSENDSADNLHGKFSHLVEDVQALADKTLAYFGAKHK